MPSPLDDRFAGPDLDRDVWFPHYLPHWSSRAETLATYQHVPAGLRLWIPPQQGLWCGDRHPEPLRVSCIQSGSRVGQQPFRPGLEVRERHDEFRGYVATYGRIAVTMRGTVSPRSMFAFWLSGFEDVPEHSGEICVAEIFGETVDDEGAAVGMGVHAFRDPALTEDFGTVRLPIDVAVPHEYAVTWRPGSVEFSVDGEEVRRVAQAPAYPCQLMIGVFDFPGRARPGDDVVPEMVVSRVTGSPLSG